MMQLAFMNAIEGGSMLLRRQHAFRIGFCLIVLVASIVFHTGRSRPTSQAHANQQILYHSTIPGDEILEKAQQQLSYDESSAASNDLIEDTTPSRTPGTTESALLLYDDPFQAMRHLKKESRKKVQVTFRTTKAPSKGRMRPVFEESGKGKGKGKGSSKASRAPSGTRRVGKGKQTKSSSKKGKRERRD